MKMGARVIAMAVCADEIGTPYPEAADLLIKSLHSNANGGRFSEAIDYYDRALAIDPGNEGTALLKEMAEGDRVEEHDTV